MVETINLRWVVPLSPIISLILDKDTIENPSQTYNWSII
jgi:hypothetical protein